MKYWDLLLEEIAIVINILAVTEGKGRGWSGGSRSYGGGGSGFGGGYGGYGGGSRYGQFQCIFKYAYCSIPFQTQYEYFRIYIVKNKSF